MPYTAGDTMKLSFLGRCFGQQIVLDLTYKCTVGNPAIPSNAVNAEIVAHTSDVGAVDLWTPYLACLPPSYALELVIAQKLWPVRESYFPFSPLGKVGTAGAATVPNDSSAITRRTALAGRSQVSVLKIGPNPTAAAVAGILTPAHIALLATLGAKTLTTLVLPITTLQFRPEILSGLGVSTNRILENFLVGSTSRIMRRRSVGIGS